MRRTQRVYNDGINAVVIQFDENDRVIIATIGAAQGSSNSELAQPDAEPGRARPTAAEEGVEEEKVSMPSGLELTTPLTSKTIDDLQVALVRKLGRTRSGRERRRGTTTLANEGKSREDDRSKKKQDAKIER